MHGDRTPPLLPPGRDELETRLIALREVSSTIPLATPTRVRARGEARRRHQATAVVTGCALAAAAVVFAIGGLPGRPQAVEPPATQAPSASASPSPSGTPSPSTSPTPTATVTTRTTGTGSTTRTGDTPERPAVTGPAGDTSLIVPPNAIDGRYFLGGDTWTDLGLGAGRPVSWHEAFDWEGGLAVYSSCDVEGDSGTRPPGVSARSKGGILNLAAEHSLGWQRVRVLDDAESARDYLAAARTKLKGCPNETKEASDGYAILTVTEHETVDGPSGDLRLVVYRTETEFADDPDSFVEWIAMGYTQTPNGRDVVTVLSTGQDADGDAMRKLGLTALNRIDSVG